MKPKVKPSVYPLFDKKFSKRIIIEFPNKKQQFEIKSSNKYYYYKKLLIEVNKVQDNYYDYQIIPLLKAKDFNRDSYWQLRIVLKKEGIQDSLNIAEQIFLQTFLEEDSNLSQDYIQALYFKQTMNKFFDNINELKTIDKDKINKVKIEMDPTSDNYSHIKLFSLIFFIEQLEIKKDMTRHNIRNPIIVDLGTGFGEAPIFFNQTIPSARIIGTDKDSSKYNQLGRKYASSNLIFIKNNFLKKSFSKLLEKYFQTKNADYLTINHVVEHINKPLELIVLKLFKNVNKKLFISIPFEKELNKESGHNRLYDVDSLKNDLGPKIKKKNPLIIIDYTYVSFGLLILTKP